MLLAERRGRMAKKLAVGARKSRMAGKASTSKRELIDTGGDKRFVKRTDRGRFKESDDVEQSLSADRRQTAKKKVKSGYGDQGDRKSASKKR